MEHYAASMLRFIQTDILRMTGLLSPRFAQFGAGCKSRKLEGIRIEPVKWQASRVPWGTFNLELDR